MAGVVMGEGGGEAVFVDSRSGSRVSWHLPFNIRQKKLIRVMARTPFAGSIMQKAP